jgi:hypothetical protein
VYSSTASRDPSLTHAVSFNSIMPENEVGKTARHTVHLLTLTEEFALDLGRFFLAWGKTAILYL